MRISKYLYICIFIYTCICICISAYSYACACVDICVCVYVYTTCEYVCMSMNMRMYTYVYMYVHMYVYMYRCTSHAAKMWETNILCMDRGRIRLQISLLIPGTAAMQAWRLTLISWPNLEKTGGNGRHKRLCYVQDQPRLLSRSTFINTLYSKPFLSHLTPSRACCAMMLKPPHPRPSKSS